MEEGGREGRKDGDGRRAETGKIGQAMIEKSMMLPLCYTYI
jgi:hypothetical protein